MRRLLIVGAGGFGREIFRWAKEARDRTWEVIAFLDCNEGALTGQQIDAEVLGDPAEYEPRDGDLFVCAVGAPTATKLAMSENLRSRGAKFVNLIHPTAIIGDSCVLGLGVIVCPYAVLTSNVTIGDFVTINVHATVGHDAAIEDGCTLSGHADVTGWATLRRGAFLGSHACVTPGAVVGEFATVGAGSVVVAKVRPHSTVFGVPARSLTGGKSE